ncbi:MAG: NAD(P)-dependent oxidoreductase [Alphaproteobacteria bacterium]|nr:NAD(P)-dependent oxidoreductase [Alphaproteobacteria bacterium]MDX5368108.1 NAD(P)-dependent oxidoreductase [Alphaproteobacteria bacterium]MDX5462947.1 NAD(P)-dependent oxidoreductase [Alphaproteobacteria bacterium]
MRQAGFIGLGAIGWPMAGRLLEAGVSLGVWGRSAARLQPAREAGAALADDAAALARDCGTVFLCVTDTDAVEEVVFGPSGIAEGVGRAGAGRVLVDLSTVDPGRTRAMAARLKERTGMGWVDAPVSGGPAGARAGTLAVMAGGEAADVEKVRPLLAAFAGHVTHMGPAGCGQATKACNQMISASTLAGVAEALTLARAFGLDVEKLPHALKGGWADSPLLQAYMPRMASGDLFGHTRTILKDLGIARALAAERGLKLPVLDHLLATYARVLEMGHGESGIGGLIHAYDADRTARGAGGAED